MSDDRDRDAEQGRGRSRLRAVARTTGFVVLGGVGLIVLLMILATVALRGARFGHVVEKLMPQMRGTIHVGGGVWSWGAVLSLVRGLPAPLELNDVQIIDPEGTEVLRVHRVAGQVTVLRKPFRAIIRQLEVEGAVWRFADMNSHKGNGFLAAFQPVSKKPAGRPRAPEPPGGGLFIEGARLIGLDATFDFKDWGLVLSGVDAGASLELRANVPPADQFRFDVRDAVAARGGKLRVVGPRSGGLQLPFTRVRLDRVATTDDAPDAILLQASDVATGRSVLTARGLFSGIYGVSRPRVPAGIDFDARFQDAADAIRAVMVGRFPDAPSRGLRIAGDGASLEMRFRGPFSRIDIEAMGSGLEAGWGAMLFRDIGFHVAAAPLSGRVHVPRISATSAGGGSFSASADLDRLRLSVDLKLDHLVTDAFLPRMLHPVGAGVLDGELRGMADLAAGEAVVESLALALERPASAGGPKVIRVSGEPNGPAPRPAKNGLGLVVAGVRLKEGALTIPTLSMPVWGGRLAAAGRVGLWDVARRRWLPAPVLDLTVSGDRIALQRALQTDVVTGVLSARVRARGTPSDLDLDFTLPGGSSVVVLHEPVHLPRQFSIHFDDGALVIPEIRLQGPLDSEATGRGRLAFSGRTDLEVRLRRYPFQRLPGLAQTKLPLDGRLSGWLRLAGGEGIGAGIGQKGGPDLSGELNIDDVTFQKRALGNGTIALSQGPHGGLHASARLMDTVTAVGDLAVAPDGLHGQAEIKMQRLRLDPLLAALPGGLSATGIVSGTLVARLVPNTPATIEGQLTDVALQLHPPARARAAVVAGAGAPPAVELHNEGDIPIAAAPGAGPLTFGPARFRGTPGAFEVAARKNGDAVDGSLRGRIDVGGLAPLLTLWVRRLAGAVDIDLKVASRAGAAARTPVALRGNIDVARPLQLALAGAPVEATIPSGRIALDGDTVETTALPIEVRSDRPAPGSVEHVEGRGRLTARLTEKPAGRKVRAHLEVGDASLSLVALGPDPLRIEGGQIDVEDLTANVRGLIVSYGRDKARVEIGAAETGPAALRLRGLEPPALGTVDIPLRVAINGLAVQQAVIDQATGQLRLRGSPRARMRLSGEVQLERAHVAVGGGGKKKKGKGGEAKAEAKGRSPLDAIDLDVAVRSHGGAVAAEIPVIPDMHVDVDVHVGGTARKPVVTGGPRAAGLYSAILLGLQKLF